SYSQNSVSFGNSFGKSGQKSAFSSKSKVAFPKTEVLGKPLWLSKKSPQRRFLTEWLRHLAGRFYVRNATN
ncbi:MAG: hypothetical protein LBD96_04705, partial [Treponema sp.]|nr:hypothetical protein [Treponema sp.]